MNDSAIRISADTSALTDSLSKIAEEMTAMKDAVSSSAAAMGANLDASAKQAEATNAAIHGLDESVKTVTDSSDSTLLESLRDVLNCGFAVPVVRDNTLSVK